MMTAAEFIARAALFDDPGFRLFKRSILSIRHGAGVIERIFDAGKYKRVLEIGTYLGVSAAFIAQRVERVTTIDLLDGQLERSGLNYDRRAFWRHMGVDNIDLVLVRDDAHKAEIVPTLKFDIAFIDGGKVNIASDFALVKRCGTVLMHDCDDRGAPDDHVYKFVTTQLPKDEVEIMDIFALWTAAKSSR